MVRWKNHIRVAMAFLWITGLSWSTTAQNTGGERYVHSPLRVQAQSQTAVLGFTPEQIRKAYGFDPKFGGKGQTIGIVVPFHNNHIEDDLRTFSRQFRLPECTSLNGCFRIIFAEQHPGTKAIWTLETALDVEWAHAIAPEANILLVEAASDLLVDLLGAVDVAVRNGASVVSMSWGLPEFSGETSHDGHFSKTGVTFVAAPGDFGNGAFYPAASPYVVGVGGTTLSIDSTGLYLGELAWSDSGGGLSPYESKPLSQPNVNVFARGIPDVAYSADPSAGFAVYSSHPVVGFKGWFQLGGTSAAAPQWAALLAISNSLRLANNKPLLSGGPAVLYQVDSANYHDITDGTNGPSSCGALCSAKTGYDYVTGLGTPRADQLIPALAAQ
jgi:subtilase family serine protease